jgi:hypothetical protein
MKVLRNIILLYALLCGFVHTAWTAIHFGSKDAGIKVPTSATVNFNGVALSDGTLYNTGGTINNTGSTYSNMTVVTRNGADIASMTLDGTVQLGTAITLFDGDRLVMAGGTVDGAVTVNNGTGQSTIEGYGSFAAPITLVEESRLNLCLASTLTQNIAWNGEGESLALVYLLGDLTFAPGFFISNEMVRLFFQGYTLNIGGNTVAPTTLTANQLWHKGRVNLTGPLSLDTDVSITFYGDEGTLEGNNNLITFGDDSFLTNQYGARLTNVAFSGVANGSFRGDNSWLLNNVSFADTYNSITVTGGFVGGGSIDVFGRALGTIGSVAFIDNSQVILNHNCATYLQWTFNQSSVLNGNSYVLDLANGSIKLNNDLVLADIVLVNVGSTSFDNRSNSTLRLSNVSWFSPDNGGIRINPLVSGEDAMGCKPATADANQGNIFTNQRTTWTNASLELLTHVTLDSDWYCENTVIDGAGKVLDLANGQLLVSGGTLTLRNMVLENVTTGSFGDNAPNGVVNLSNVTIKLSGDADFSSYGLSFVISGPVTFITGAYSFTTWNGILTGSSIDGVTAYYDTLSAADASNVVGFRLDNNARLLFIASPLTGDILVDVDGTTYLGRTEYLAADADGYAGRSLTFDVDGTVTYDGLGRSLVFPVTTSPVFTVTADTKVITENITLQGLISSQLNVDGTLYFGDKTTIRLTQDWILDFGVTFGSSNVATGEEMVLDLNGFTINLDDADAALLLQGGTGNVLRICNGRLTDLSGTKLAAQSGSKIIFENVECALTHTELVEDVVTGVDYVFANNAGLEFQGHCLITGRPGVAFRNQSSVAPIITQGSVLSVMYNMIYWHDTDAGFTFDHVTSTLELIGATFKSDAEREEPLVLGRGIIIIDHKSVLHVGSAGINLGDGGNELDLEIRPSATITVAGTGTLLYQPEV